MPEGFELAEDAIIEYAALNGVMVRIARQQLREQGCTNC
jgi:hypothetical protein